MFCICRLLSASCDHRTYLTAAWDRFCWIDIGHTARLPNRRCIRALALACDVVSIAIRLPFGFCSVRKALELRPRVHRTRGGTFASAHDVHVLQGHVWHSWWLHLVDLRRFAQAPVVDCADLLPLIAGLCQVRAASTPTLVDEFVSLRHDRLATSELVPTRALSALATATLWDCLLLPVTSSRGACCNRVTGARKVLRPPLRTPVQRTRAAAFIHRFVVTLFLFRGTWGAAGASTAACSGTTGTALHRVCSCS